LPNCEFVVDLLNCTPLFGQSPMIAACAYLTAELKAEARRLGFALVGACPAISPPGTEHLGQWLSAGYAGEMHYLPDRVAAYENPRSILDGVRSLLMLACVYRTAQPREAGPGEGRVSRYAWGADYHELIRSRLDSLVSFLRSRRPAARVRGAVDTAPLMEGEFAQLAGLGWIGKNTLLLNKNLGSWFFLAALLTDEELEYDAPHAVDHCGTCRACLDACPTGAFVAPYVLDARRCISYLTIELRSPVPHELRPGIGDWLFGCDVCQEVCPWNERLKGPSEPAERAFEPAEGMNPIRLAELFELDDEAFRQRFRHTPLWRAKRRGLLRNAAIVLGNRPNPEAINALVRGLNDAEPLVRGACAWALAGYSDPAAQRALTARRSVEIDPAVLAELNTAKV
jgi:epoxyqueuosine reductase